MSQRLKELLRKCDNQSNILTPSETGELAAFAGFYYAMYLIARSKSNETPNLLADVKPDVTGAMLAGQVGQAAFGPGRLAPTGRDPLQSPVHY